MKPGNTQQRDNDKQRAAQAVVRLMEQLEYEGDDGTVLVEVSRHRGKWGNVRGGTKKEMGKG